MKRLSPLLIVWLLASEAWAAPPARIILVFPFENRSPRADLNWMSESFPEILSSRLATAASFALGREERNAACEQLGISPGSPMTLASKYKVAEILTADWAVMGSFTVDDNGLSVRAQLLDVRQLRLAPALEVSGNLTELVDLQTRLAWRLLALRDPNFTVGKEEDFRQRFPEVRLDAFENYIRGILATNEESRVRFLQEADRLNPSDHRAAFELGRHYFEQKDYANSAKWFRKLNAADPNYLESLFLLAVDEFFLGNEAAAEKAFEALLKEMPLNEVRNDLGVMKLRRRAYQEALVSFERAYRGDPGDADFCFNLAVCLYYLKRYDEAARYLEKALRANDDDPEAHALLEDVFERLGNSAGRRREQQWLADNNEGSSAADSRNDVVPQARLKKNFDGRAFRLLSLAIRKALEEGLAGGPPEQHGMVHLLRGKRFIEDARWQEAERELVEAATLLPADSEAHLVLARVYEAQGRHREAAEELEKSLKLEETAAAHLGLARLYLALNQPLVARDHGEAALRLDPANREAERIIDQIRAGASAPRAMP